MNRQAIKYILILFLTISINSFASTTTAEFSASQEWDDPASWDNGVPGCFDSIIIPAGVFIEVTSMEDLTSCPATIIIVEGELNFQTGKKLTLVAGSSIEVPNGGTITGSNGGGNSSYIEIGTDIVWAASDGDLTGPIVLCPSCPLAVELDFFKIDLTPENVILLWRTNSEFENSHFIVERKIENDPWTFFAKVDGHGTTSESVQYQFIDHDRHTSRVYYRLTQYDFNLTSEMLGIRCANFEQNCEIISSYTLDGRSVDRYEPGYVLVRYSNGTTSLIFN